MFCLVPMGTREVFWYPWGARDTLFCVGEILCGAWGGKVYFICCYDNYTWYLQGQGIFHLVQGQLSWCLRWE